MLIEDYLISIKVKLLTRAVIHSFTIVKEQAILDQGYFRARLTLKNGDFCEIVELFTANDQACITESYRYQWMDSTKQNLRKRWDNVEHFPGLPNFPHHIHILEETNVYPGRSLNILEFIDCLDQKIDTLS